MEQFNLRLTHEASEIVQPKKNYIKKLKIKNKNKKLDRVYWLLVLV